MSTNKKIVSGVLASFLVITFLHAWLNIGLTNLGLVSDPQDERFRVGFLPVT